MLTRRKFLGMLGKVAGAFAVLPFLKPVVESIPDDCFDTKDAKFITHFRYGPNIAWDNTAHDSPFDPKDLAEAMCRHKERIAAQTDASTFTCKRITDANR